MACLREKEEAALQEPGPDPVPEGGEPGQQAVLQARRQDVAVVTGESAPALCRGAAKNFILHFQSIVVHFPSQHVGSLRQWSLYISIRGFKIQSS